MGLSGKKLNHRMPQMSMNTWISKQEEQLMNKVAQDLEQAMWWGHSPNSHRIRTALVKTLKFLQDGKITSDQSITLHKMIESSSSDNLDFAETLIEHFSTQNSIQYGSIIQTEGS
jgi:hypothetical protein